MDQEPTWTISQLAEQFEISTRTIRFYEEKGLILPRRTPGGHRVYTKRNRARLKLILRGKRFGYSLDEIADMIGLADEDMDEKKQILKTLDYGERTLVEIREKMADLKLFEEDLRNMSERLKKRLTALEQEVS